LSSARARRRRGVQLAGSPDSPWGRPAMAVHRSRASVLMRIASSRSSSWTSNWPVVAPRISMRSASGLANAAMLCISRGRCFASWTVG
jgi:hypothetical protein